MLPLRPQLAVDGGWQLHHNLWLCMQQTRARLPFTPLASKRKTALRILEPKIELLQTIPFLQILHNGIQKPKELVGIAA